MNSAAVERRPVPKRARPFAKAHKHIPKLLKLFLGRELSPSRDEYDRVVDALWDGDVLLLKVDQMGPACHTGAPSCFFRKLD